MANRGRMTSKCDISESVFGRKLEPFDRSIDMHVSNLRKKIAVHTPKETIRTIRGGGYMMVASWIG
jgi:two-component system response regulator CpxR